VSCIERAGWFSGLFSAVKLVQSFSISGPSATAKPIEPKISSMRRQVRLTGCRPPRPRPRPGSVTSSASSARRASSFACARAPRRSSSAASMLSLAALIAWPAALRSSAESLPSDFSSPVSSPALPRKRALAFSSAAGSPAAANSARARATISSGLFSARGWP
jgi:hypothetical protein